MGAFGGARDPREALRTLERRKREIEREAEELRARRERGEIDEGEYARRLDELKKEYIEVMDRLAQVRFLMEG